MPTRARASATTDAPLAAYQAKRDFGATPEPRGRAGARLRAHELTFVVQKHDARRLHYDVRLEIGGALMSFAVPKGPSSDPAIKRLAIETEDHPLAYADFEGRIPDGEYGAGDVLLWDRGRYETVPPGEELRMREKGHLHVRLFGTKLRGEWHFVRTARGRGDAPHAPAQWLMFRGRGAGAAEAREEPTAAHPESVVSGRVATRGPARRAAEVGEGARALAEQVGELALATGTRGAEELGDPHAYLYELKYDGYRVLAAKVGEDVSLSSRQRRDWTERFDVVARAVRALPVGACVIDGEVCAVDARGIPSFQRLQRWASGEEPDTRLSYAAFDLLHVDGRDLRGEPFERRRELLASLLGAAGEPAREWTRAGARAAPKRQMAQRSSRRGGLGAEALPAPPT